MRPDAIALSVGLWPSEGPESVETLEKLLEAGASPDEPAADVPEGPWKDLSPLLLLLKKHVLLAGSRAETLLEDGGSSWEAAAGAVPVQAQADIAAAFTGAGGVKPFHACLASEFQPLAWWRMLHGLILLLQLPADEEPDENEPSFNDSQPTRPSTGESQFAWDQSLMEVVKLRTSGATNEMGGWRSRARLRIEALEQYEDFLELSQEADLVAQQLLEGQSESNIMQRAVFEAQANARRASVNLMEARRALWREYITQLSELNETAEEQEQRRGLQFAVGVDALANRRSLRVLQQKTSLSMFMKAASPGATATPVSKFVTTFKARAAGEELSNRQMAPEAVVVNLTEAPNPAQHADEAPLELNSEANVLDDLGEENGYDSEDTDDENGAQRVMGQEEWTGLTKRIFQENKVVTENQMRRLRYLAAEKPALNLAQHLCRILLFPPKVPPAALSTLKAAVEVDSTFDGLHGETDKRPAERLHRVLSCCLQHSTVLHCIGALLRAEANLLAVDASGATVLHVACSPARPRLLDHILRHGAGSSWLQDALQSKDGDGRTPAAVAIGSGTHAERACLQLLLTAGAPLANREELNKSTLLHLAIEAGLPAQLQTLLQFSQIRNVPANDLSDSSGLTPLAVAVRLGQHSCVSLLLEHRASVDTCDATGRTPLDHATEVQDATCVQLVLRAVTERERRRLLIYERSRADAVLAKKSEGPLLVAARQRSPVILQAMMAEAPSLWRVETECDLHRLMLDCAIATPTPECVTTIMRVCSPLQSRLLELMDRCVTANQESLVPIICEFATATDMTLRDDDGDTVLHILLHRAQQDAQTVDGDKNSVGCRLLAALIGARPDLYLLATDQAELTALGAAPKGSYCAGLLLNATISALRRAKFSIIYCKRESYMYAAYAEYIAKELRKTFPGLRPQLQALFGMQQGELPQINDVIGSILQHLLGPGAQIDALEDLLQALSMVALRPEMRPQQDSSGSSNTSMSIDRSLEILHAVSATKGAALSKKKERLAPLKASASAPQIVTASNASMRSHLQSSASMLLKPIQRVRQTFTSNWMMKPLERPPLPQLKFQVEPIIRLEKQQLSGIDAVEVVQLWAKQERRRLLEEVRYRELRSRELSSEAKGKQHHPRDASEATISVSTHAQPTSSPASETVTPQENNHAATPPAPDRRPSWFVYLDLVSLSPYYYHEKSGETTWNAPYPQLAEEGDALVVAEVLKRRRAAKEAQEAREKEAELKARPPEGSREAEQLRRKAIVAQRKAAQIQRKAELDATRAAEAAARAAAAGLHRDPTAIIAAKAAVDERAVKATKAATAEAVKAHKEEAAKEAMLQARRDERERKAVEKAKAEEEKAARRKARKEAAAAVRAAQAEEARLKAIREAPEAAEMAAAVEAVKKELALRAAQEAAARKAAEEAAATQAAEALAAKKAEEEAAIRRAEEEAAAKKAAKEAAKEAAKIKAAEQAAAARAAKVAVQAAEAAKMAEAIKAAAEAKAAKEAAAAAAAKASQEAAATIASEQVTIAKAAKEAATTAAQQVQMQAAVAAAAKEAKEKAAIAAAEAAEDAERAEHAGVVAQAKAEAQAASKARAEEDAVLAQAMEEAAKAQAAAEQENAARAAEEAAAVRAAETAAVQDAGEKEAMSKAAEKAAAVAMEAETVAKMQMEAASVALDLAKEAADQAAVDKAVQDLEAAAAAAEAASVRRNLASAEANDAIATAAAAKKAAMDMEVAARAAKLASALNAKAAAKLAAVATEAEDAAKAARAAAEDATATEAAAVEAAKEKAAAAEAAAKRAAEETQAAQAAEDAAAKAAALQDAAAQTATIVAKEAEEAAQRAAAAEKTKAEAEQAASTETALAEASAAEAAEAEAAALAAAEEEAAKFDAIQTAAAEAGAAVLAAAEAAAAAAKADELQLKRQKMAAALVASAAQVAVERAVAAAARKAVRTAATLAHEAEITAKAKSAEEEAAALKAVKSAAEAKAAEDEMKKIADGQEETALAAEEAAARAAADEAEAKMAAKQAVAALKAAEKSTDQEFVAKATQEAEERSIAAREAEQERATAEATAASAARAASTALKLARNLMISARARKLASVLRGLVAEKIAKEAAEAEKLAKAAKNDEAAAVAAEQSAAEAAAAEAAAEEAAAAEAAAAEAAAADTAARIAAEEAKAAAAASAASLKAMVTSMVTAATMVAVQRAIEAKEAAVAAIIDTTTAEAAPTDEKAANLVTADGATAASASLPAGTKPTDVGVEMAPTNAPVAAEEALETKAAHPEQQVKLVEPMLVTRAYSPRGETQLRVENGDLVIPLGTPRNQEWVQVMPIKIGASGLEEAEHGFIPGSCIVKAPHDGVMTSTFNGENEGEAAQARTGQRVWVLSLKEDDGWAYVLLDDYTSGYIPTSFIEWTNDVLAKGQPQVRPTEDGVIITEPVSMDVVVEEPPDSHDEEQSAWQTAAKAFPLAATATRAPNTGSELFVSLGDLLVPLAPPTDAGMTRVATLALDQTGLVPSEILTPAPPHGMIRVDFDGLPNSTEIEHAPAGALLWIIQQGEQEWVPVFVEGGGRGNVPRSYVDWFDTSLAEASTTNEYVMPPASGESSQRSTPGTPAPAAAMTHAEAPTVPEGAGVFPMEEDGAAETTMIGEAGVAAVKAFGSENPVVAPMKDAAARLPPRSKALKTLQRLIMPSRLRPQTKGDAPENEATTTHRPDDQEALATAATPAPLESEPKTLLPMKEPMLVREDFSAESKNELDVQQGDLVLVVSPTPVDDKWAAVRLIRSGQSGYVPTAFLIDAPCNGVILADFQGTAEAEVKHARAGDKAWVLGGTNGAMYVYLGDGVTGNVPASFIRWLDDDIRDWAQQQTSQTDPEMAAEKPIEEPKTLLPMKEPMLIREDFSAESKNELDVQQGDLVLVVSPTPVDDKWAAVRLIRSGQSGYVPTAFLIDAPISGVMLADFQGEEQAEAKHAHTGQKLWAIGGARGWVFVYLEDGNVGNVPITFVEWVDKDTYDMLKADTSIPQTPNSIHEDVS